MPNEFYSKGTIKVKNQDGILEPFHPKTDFSSVEDAEGTTLTQIVSNISTQIAAAENSGGIELIYEEPTNYNTASYANETMMAWMEPTDDEFIIVVDTTKTTSETVTAIPFNLYNSNATITVDWGDGTVQTLTSSDYSDTNYDASIHHYEKKGTYQVSLNCSNWNDVYYIQSSGINPLTAKSSIEQNGEYIPGYSNSSYNIRYCISLVWIWQATLIKILTPIPNFLGMKVNRSKSSSSSPDPSYSSLTTILSTYADLENTNTSSYCSIISECINLEYLCAEALKNIPTAIHLFRGCLSLKNIDVKFSNLFQHLNQNITNFSGCFSYCMFSSIENNTFERFANIKFFNDCFYDCTSLESVPSGLFASNTAVINFTNCFCSCTSLESVPSGLFASNTSATIFDGCFQNCYALESVPSGLFASNASAASFDYSFQGCRSLASIPAGLFDSNTSVTNFSSCFKNCTSLTSIPSTLFQYNINARYFRATFKNCTSLTSIPSTLFQYNINATTFYANFGSGDGCFEDCISLTSIPEDLFKYNTLATEFGNCFKGCTSLTSIPSELFRYNTEVTFFGKCFEGCTSLTSIPEDLFKYNIKVNRFWRCFYGCTSLTSIPENLFRYNTLTTDFERCFEKCSSIGNFSIHIGSPNVTYCNDFVTIKSSAARTVYVPNGSTTQTRFNNIASSLGLTIIGE